MTFPVRVPFKTAEAIIYGRSEVYAYYRVSWHAGGQRRMKSCPTYSEAKKLAKQMARAAYRGDQSAALWAKEASEMLSIREALRNFKVDTGRSLTALQAVSGYLDAAKLLGDGHSMKDAVKGFLATVVSVKRMPLADAVSEFNATRKAKTIVREGQIRPAMHPTYYNDTARFLNEVAGMFKGHAVCDLTREHVSKYLSGFGDLSAKSRNDRRTTLKLFLKWAVSRDYLSPSHRLAEAEGMKHEASDASPPECYTAKEVAVLLANSEGEVRAVIALQALGGLRLQEVFRLEWRNVFSIPNHVEIPTTVAKGRQRRLVEMCASLQQWIEPYRQMEGRVVTKWATLNGFVQAFAALRQSVKKVLRIPSRRNGLRHGAISAFYALHDGNENLASSWAGNSPQMVHQHYKGLITRKEAEAWFNTRPAALDNVVVLPSKEA